MADTDRGTYRPTTDAYTGMLAISLLALIAACVFLFLDYSQYPEKAPPPVPKAAPPEAAVKAPPPPPKAEPPAPMPDDKKDDEKKAG